MAKMFSTSSSPPTTQAQKKTARERALEAAKAIDEAKLDEGVAAELQGKIQAMKQTMTVQAIAYKTFRKAGKKWLVEHGQAGSDYMFQLIPIKPTVTKSQDILLLLITTMDSIYPKTVEIFYSRPNPSMQINFWTIKAQGVADMPGFERALARTLEGLSDVDAWQ